MSLPHCEKNLLSTQVFVQVVDSAFKFVLREHWNWTGVKFKSRYWDTKFVPQELILPATLRPERLPANPKLIEE